MDIEGFDSRLSLGLKARRCVYQHSESPIIPLRHEGPYFNYFVHSRHVITVSIDRSRMETMGPTVCGNWNQPRTYGIGSAELESEYGAPRTFFAPPALCE